MSMALAGLPGTDQSPTSSASDHPTTDRRMVIDDLIAGLREDAEALWRQGGGDCLSASGQETDEQRGHKEAFCAKLLAEALHDLLSQQLPDMDAPSTGSNAAPGEDLETRAAGTMAAIREKERNHEVRKKDSPDDDDVLGQEALERAQRTQRRLVELNYREGKPQVVMASATEVVKEVRLWPAPELHPSLEEEGPLYGNLYPQAPSSRVRCVLDDFASPAECRDVSGHCVRGMHCMFRRGGQTSLAVSADMLSRRLGEQGAEVILGLVERTRLRVARELAGEQPLYESGALLTRLQADWVRDMWEISGEEEHAYWNVHVDKANVASYDFAALLYLNSQGEHFEGGDFAFVDAQRDELVAPKMGRLLAFTAGPENLHQVRRVTKGTRFVLAMWFTLSEKHQRKD